MSEIKSYQKRKPNNHIFLQTFFNRKHPFRNEILNHKCVKSHFKFEQ